MNVDVRFTIWICMIWSVRDWIVWCTCCTYCHNHIIHIKQNVIIKPNRQFHKINFYQIIVLQRTTSVILFYFLFFFLSLSFCLCFRQFHLFHITFCHLYYTISSYYTLISIVVTIHSEFRFISSTCFRESLLFYFIIFLHCL